MGYRYTIAIAVVFGVIALAAGMFTPGDRVQRRTAVLAIPALVLVLAGSFQLLLHSMVGLGAHDSVFVEHSTSTGLLAVLGLVVGVAVTARESWPELSEVRAGLLPPLPDDGVTSGPDDLTQEQPTDETDKDDDSEEAIADKVAGRLPFFGLVGIACGLAAQAPLTLGQWDASLNGRGFLADSALGAFIAAVAAVGLTAWWGSLELAPIAGAGALAALGALGISWASNDPLTAAVAGLGAGLLLLPVADAVSGGITVLGVNPVLPLAAGALLLMLAAAGNGVAQPGPGEFLAPVGNIVPAPPAHRFPPPGATITCSDSPALCSQPEPAPPP